MTQANNKQLRERKQRRERVIELDDETINDYPPLDAHEDVFAFVLINQPRIMGDDT